MDPREPWAADVEELAQRVHKAGCILQQPDLDELVAKHGAGAAYRLGQRVAELRAAPLPATLWATGQKMRDDP